MKNNLVRFPKLPGTQSEPGPDFEKHHYVLEAPGRRVALDLFTRVVDLTSQPDPALKDLPPSPAQTKRKSRGKQRG
jgi:hypothetical protein